MTAAADTKRMRYQNDPEYRAMLLARNKAWKESHPGQRRESDRAYRERNRERRFEQYREYRAANPEKVREWRRAWDAQNREYNRVRRAEWIAANPDKVAAYRAQAGSAQKEWRTANREYVAQIKRSYEDNRERVVNPKAVNHRTPWTEAELKIALDRSLTEVEAALMLGRTVRAVSNKRHKVRRAAA